MYLSACHFLLQSLWTPKQKSARRDEAKKEREPIPARHRDDMNLSITDGNPADERIIRNYCALFYAKFHPLLVRLMENST